MSDSKCLIFSDNEDIKIEIMKLIEHGWIHEMSAVERMSYESIQQFSVGFGGISGTKLTASLVQFGNPKYIIIDGGLYNSSITQQVETSLAISYKAAKSSSDLYLIDIALYIQFWAARSLFSCSDPDCLLSTHDLASLRQVLCLKCQQKLPVHISISLLSLISLKGMQQQPAFQYINEKLGLFLREHTINLEIAEAKSAMATFIIDYVIDTNDNLRKWLKDCGSYVKESKNEFRRKYSELSQPIPSFPFFIAARRWNSWTPNIPGKTKNLGGGYIVSDGITKVAIDPGYGFLEMMSAHGITIMDVDGIVVTHDHPDHIAELQNILSLRHEFKETQKKLQLYLNGSTYYLYHRLASYYRHILECDPVRVKAGTPIRLGDLTINTCKMYHKEIYDHLPADIRKKVRGSASLGLSITGPFGENSFNFAILGDTSFPDNSKELQKLVNFFGKPDIAAVHIGSIEPEWDSDKKAALIHYENGKHLGLNGVIKSIHLLRPKVAVITEFGEEHDRHDDRLSISAVVKEACSTATTAVIPSDIKLRLTMSNYGILAKCSGDDCHGFVHIKNVELSLSSDKSICYSFPSGCKSRLSHFFF